MHQNRKKDKLQIINCQSYWALDLKKSCRVDGGVGNHENDNNVNEENVSMKKPTSDWKSIYEKQKYFEESGFKVWEKSKWIDRKNFDGAE